MVVGKPLYTVNEIQQKVKELGERISRDYEGKDLLVVSILRGAFMFTSDLIRNIRIPLTLDFVMASSYVKTNTSGEVKLHCDIREPVRGRHILLVEDIIDTGVTLNYLRERFLQKEPESLKICGLLNKKPRRIADIPVEYIGFDIPDIFVVGYGLDYDNQFRNLPYIAVFKKSG
jgi:hypoxanthine phosphoribosyltransferase